jgi:hypothetical protein
MTAGQGEPALPNANPISVGRFNGVWFASRTRARAMLQGYRRDVIPIHDAVRWIQEALHEYPGALRKVRWVDQELDKERFRFTVAICYVESRPAARQLLFELGQEMVKATGWYPMVHGEPLGGGAQVDIVHQNFRRHTLPRIPLGPVSVQDAVNRNKRGGGCAIRLQVGDSSILLDSGYRQSRAISSMDSLVWISHAHADHFQGWTTAPDPPIAVMSEGTANLLHALGHIDNERLRSVRVLSLNPDFDWYYLGQDIRIRPFAVPHYPGAAGLEMHIGDTNLFYTGDVSLHTARLDFLERLIGRINPNERQRNFVLLDATMANRDAGANAEDVPAALFRAAALAGAKDIVISAPSADHLLYAHLDMFNYVSRNKEQKFGWWFLMPEQARPVFQAVHYRWSKLRSGRSSDAARRLDPFLFAQYGGTLNAWGESTWLLWLRPGSEAPPPPHGRIWYVTPESRDLVKPSSPMIWAHMPWGRREGPFTDWAPYRVDVDTSPWTMHTSAKYLAEAVGKLSKRASVILFHQSEANIQQFINDYNLEARPLTREAIPLLAA